MEWPNIRQAISILPGGSNGFSIASTAFDRADTPFAGSPASLEGCRLTGEGGVTCTVGAALLRVLADSNQASGKRNRCCVAGRSRLAGRLERDFALYRLHRAARIPLLSLERSY
jgi:hypothetical protein